MRKLLSALLFLGGLICQAQLPDSISGTTPPTSSYTQPGGIVFGPSNNTLSGSSVFSGTNTFTGVTNTFKNVIDGAGTGIISNFAYYGNGSGLTGLSGVQSNALNIYTAQQIYNAGVTSLVVNGNIRVLGTNTCQYIKMISGGDFRIMTSANGNFLYIANGDGSGAIQMYYSGTLEFDLGANTLTHSAASCISWGINGHYLYDGFKAGTTASNGGFIVGSSGNVTSNIWIVSSVCSYSNLSAGASVNQWISCPGARTNDTISVGYPADHTPGLIIYPVVGSNDWINAMGFNSFTVTAINQQNRTYKFRVSHD